jgi:ribonuclease HIII
MNLTVNLLQLHRLEPSNIENKMQQNIIISLEDHQIVNLKLKYHNQVWFKRKNPTQIQALCHKKYFRRRKRLLGRKLIC